MVKTVTCTVPTAEHAARIIKELKARGFSQSEVSVLMPREYESETVWVDEETKAPEGAATGATAGAALGGGLGWLIGLGSLAVPGLGPLIAAGPILAALTGAAVGGTLGGVAGTLVGLGIPASAATLYEDQLRTGSALVVVRAKHPTATNLARDIFMAAGASNIVMPSDS